MTEVAPRRLDAADAEIERAVAAGDVGALRRLADELEADAGALLGEDGRGLIVAAARARAAATRLDRREPRPEPLAPAYAGWWRRVGAFVLDWLVLSLAYGLLQAATGGALSVWLLLFGAIAYFTALHALDGRTLGKRVAGIAVRTADGGPIGVATALGRTIAQALLCLVVVGFLLDSLWALWDRSAQTLHDKAAATVVVRAR